MNAQCNDCNVTAVKARCSACNVEKWGNGRECWKCHDRIAHAMSAKLSAQLDAIPESEFRIHSQFGGLPNLDRKARR